MNRKIGMASSLINIFAVAGFALCMMFDFLPGTYLTSMFIAFSFVPMMCTFHHYAAQDKNVAGLISIIFSGMYAVMILFVYFAQVTAVRLDGLNEQAMQIIDYQKFGLFFSYDLLGYGLMAFSTFFAGLTVIPKSMPDKWLRWLLIIHGVFFIPCFILPMLGLFNTEMQGADWIGTAILTLWCVYFIPVGVLSFIHFRKAEVSGK